MGDSIFFSATIRHKTGFIRLFGSIALVALGLLLGQIPLTYFLIRDRNEDAPLDLAGHGLDPTLLLFLMIIGFLGGLIGLGLAVRYIHNQPFKSLITPDETLDWKRIILSFSLWLLLMALVELILYAWTPQHYAWTFVASKFWPLLIVALFFLPIQTSCEEIFFRGYLMQQLGVMLNHKWAALVISSVLFGLLHTANPEVKAFGFTTMMIYYIGFGLLLGLCTILDNRLELALGVHAATNIYSATVVTFKESAIQTPAMITLRQLDVPLMTLLFFLSALLYFAYFARRYRWRLRDHGSRLVRVHDSDSAKS